MGVQDFESSQVGPQHQGDAVTDGVPEGDEVSFEEIRQAKIEEARRLAKVAYLSLESGIDGYSV